MEQRLLQQIKQRYGVVGNSELLNHALDICLQVAPTDLSVLIIGESGVGKEVLPRIIHDNSPRKRERYFAINCGSIPEGTIDSELFGHEKGAYTGAIDEGDGYFGIANKGTLFLDEVGELPLATQARLLRVLETGEYIRVGGTEVRKTDVRIVAATNVNMVKAISEGKFRRDLYYRLNSIPVRMPALRERGNDIISLFRLFALQMVEKYKVPRLDLTEDAKRLLLKYKWPGNVRQLKNVTEQISLLSEDRTITAEQLLKFIPDDEESMAVATYSTTSSSESHSYEQERQLLFNFLVELQNSVQRLNGEVQELQKQVIALGGQPVSMSHTVLSLPPANPQIEPHTYEVADSEEIKSESHDTMESLNVGDNERELLKKALQRCGGNRKNAAKELGISDRTLYRRLKQLNLE
ncbi:MAG: sigma-54 dependent transcriptional regulator [Prevotella sp.]|nr:sigma-54 dependent transcriptional regulator [Prevotella sp.]